MKDLASVTYFGQNVRNFTVKLVLVTLEDMASFENDNPTLFTPLAPSLYSHIMHALTNSPGPVDASCQ